MNRWYFLLLAALLMAGCGDDSDVPYSDDERAASGQALEVVVQTDSYGFTETFQRRIADGLREGEYRRYNADSVLVEEASYRRDTLDGLRVLYFDSGDTLAVEPYDLGNFAGEFRQYYENGQLQIRGNYVDNKMTGKWYQYYDSGELMEEVTFRNNQENGPFIEYYRNGNLKAEGNYLNGDNEHGLLKLYNEDGELVQKMNCEEGVCRTIWRSEDG